MECCRPMGQSVLRVALVLIWWCSTAVASPRSTSHEASLLESPTFVSPTGESGPVFLTADERRERAAIIRDTAAAAGMTNAALLAGIGQVETQFAHCYSEATWACEGPSSSSCGGGAVIAGG